MKAFIIILLVVGGIFGLLLTLRSSRNTGMPDGEVMKRAQQRARDQAAADKDD